MSDFVIGANGAKKRLLEKEKILSMKRMWNWCLWKVLLPLGMIVVLYPVYRFVVEIDHPFERAFAHGDLLLLSVIILLEAAVEGEQVQDQNVKFHLGIGFAKLFAIFLVVIFAFLKMDVLLHETGKAIGGQAGEDGSVVKSLAVMPAKFLYYSYFNWLVAGSAIVYSLVAFWTIMGKEQIERLNEIAGDHQL